MCQSAQNADLVLGANRQKIKWRKKNRTEYVLKEGMTGRLEI